MCKDLAIISNIRKKNSQESFGIPKMTSLKTLKKKEMLNVILQCLWEFKTFGLENTFKTFGLEKTTPLHRHAVLTQSLTSHLVWQYWNICTFINWNGMVCYYYCYYYKFHMHLYFSSFFPWYLLNFWIRNVYKWFYTLNTNIIHKTFM